MCLHEQALLLGSQKSKDPGLHSCELQQIALSIFEGHRLYFCTISTEISPQCFSYSSGSQTFTGKLETMSSSCGGRGKGRNIIVRIMALPWTKGEVGTKGSTSLLWDALACFCIAPQASEYLKIRTHPPSGSWLGNWKWDAIAIFRHLQALCIPLPPEASATPR